QTLYQSEVDVYVYYGFSDLNVLGGGIMITGAWRATTAWGPDETLAGSGAPRVRAHRASAPAAHRRDRRPGPRPPHLHDAAGRVAGHGAPGGARLLQRLQPPRPELHGARGALRPEPAPQRRARARPVGHVGRLPGLECD